MRITYSMCVSVALVNQHHTCAILSFVACADLEHFSTFSHKRHDFRNQKALLNIKCVFRFSVQFVSQMYLIIRRNERDIIKLVRWSSYKVRVILVIL